MPNLWGSQPCEYSEGSPAGSNTTTSPEGSSWPHPASGFLLQSSFRLPPGGGAGTQGCLGPHVPCLPLQMPGKQRVRSRWAPACHSQMLPACYTHRHVSPLLTKEPPNVSEGCQRALPSEKNTPFSQEPAGCCRAVGQGHMLCQPGEGTAPGAPFLFSRFLFPREDRQYLVTLLL